MIGTALRGASRSPRLRQAVIAAPVTRRVVDRFVAGEQLGEALTVVRRLVGHGLLVTLDHLGEDVTTAADALAARDAYLRALDAVGAAALGTAVEVSVKLSAFGQSLPGGHELSLASVEPVAAAAADVGTTVTLDMEDHATVDATLAVLQSLRARFPATGVALQSHLLRTPDDARALATPGSRVRLVKGAYREPAQVALQDRTEVDRAYRDCLDILLGGPGYPMIGTHDPQLIAAGLELAERHGKGRDSFEFQLLYGVRPHEQLRLVGAGFRTRAYVPYGGDWYAYFMRRLAERPQNLAFFLRSLASRR